MKPRSMNSFAQLNCIHYWRQRLWLLNLVQNQLNSGSIKGPTLLLLDYNVFLCQLIDLDEKTSRFLRIKPLWVQVYHKMLREFRTFSCVVGCIFLCDSNFFVIKCVGNSRTFVHKSGMKEMGRRRSKRHFVW